jgi:hypothetical protein
MKNEKLAKNKEKNKEKSLEVKDIFVSRGGDILEEQQSGACVSHPIDKVDLFCIMYNKGKL